MGQVIRLHPPERVLHDGEAIATLYRNLGNAVAEQMVGRALAELALAMTGLAAQVRRHELKDLSRRMQTLRAMAENLGMTSLATVADDARRCLERCDGTGFAAVWARLLRVAERSLNGKACPADLSG